MAEILLIFKMLGLLCVRRIRTDLSQIPYLLPNPLGVSYFIAQSDGARDPPRANAYCERFTGSVHRECLDRLLAFGEGHLRRIMQGYVT